MVIGIVQLKKSVLYSGSLHENIIGIEIGQFAGKNDRYRNRAWKNDRCQNRSVCVKKICIIIGKCA